MSLQSILDQVKINTEIKRNELIERTVEVQGYAHSVSFDPDHTVSYGYWICKKCQGMGYFQGDADHAMRCSSISKNKEMIYVLGPNENGAFAPFKKGEIEKIKEIARAKLPR